MHDSVAVSADDGALQHADQRSTPRVSVVTPVFNEEACIAEFHRRVSRVMEARGDEYEIVFVDDGSSDGSARELQQLFAQDSHVRVLRFVRNYGQQAAIAAGLEHARGDRVVLLDADLQQPPEAIPSLLDELAKGHRIVYGAPAKLAQPMYRRLGSRVAQTILAKATGHRWPETLSAFAALDRRLVDQLCLHKSKTRFFSGLAASLSDGQWAVVPVEHFERHGGKSKYSLGKLAGLGMQFLVTSTEFPLRAGLYLGGAGLLATAFGSIAWMVARLAGFDAMLTPGVAMIGALIGLFGSLQLVVLGFLGAYIGVILRDVKDQPEFLVDKVFER